MLLLFFFSLVFCVPSPQDLEGVTWAVLIAGSKGYSNFRHQADICQAYQQLKQQGLPEERIITFMYDDIADSWENPKKGTIINYPGGPDVYSGVVKDYTKLHVSPSNFLNVLKGEEMKVGSKKTLKSTAEDRVFIYFADHGGPGILCFPFQLFESLHAKDVIETLEYMQSHNMYKELVFYVEACESGSIFNGNLKDSMNVYAVTASNPFESSWACDYSDEYKSYLNDCWSGDFLADSRDAMDKGTFSSRTLDQQFIAVHNVSVKSPECRYGSLAFKDMTLNYFQGEPSSVQKDSSSSLRKGRMNGVSSRDVHLDILQRRADEGMDGADEELKKYLSHMKQVDSFWTAFKEELKVPEWMSYMKGSNDDDHCNSENDEVLLDLDCNKEVITMFEQLCGGFDEYSIRYSGLLSSACVQGIEMNEVESFLKKNC